MRCVLKARPVLRGRLPLLRRRRADAPEAVTAALPALGHGSGGGGRGGCAYRNGMRLGTRRGLGRWARPSRGRRHWLSRGCGYGYRGQRGRGFGGHFLWRSGRQRPRVHDLGRLLARPGLLLHPQLDGELPGGIMCVWAPVVRRVGRVHCGRHLRFVADSHVARGHDHDVQPAERRRWLAERWLVRSCRRRCRRQPAKRRRRYRHFGRTNDPWGLKIDPLAQPPSSPPSAAVETGARLASSPTEASSKRMAQAGPQSHTPPWQPHATPHALLDGV